MPLSANTRASSIVSTVPLPSSFAPGAGSSGSKAGSASEPRRVSAIAQLLTARVGQRVVMSRDVNPPRIPAPGQDRHDVPHLDRARDAFLGRKRVRVETDAKLRARPLQLVEDPLAAPRRMPRAVDAGSRKCVARAEAREPFVRAAGAVLRRRTATSFSMRASASTAGAPCAPASVFDARSSAVGRCCSM